jgi:hypothetical protein
MKVPSISASQPGVYTVLLQYLDPCLSTFDTYSLARAPVAPWLMINGSDDRYQILAATGLNIDPILVVAKTLNIGIYWHILV